MTYFGLILQFGNIALHSFLLALKNAVISDFMPGGLSNVWYSLYDVLRRRADVPRLLYYYVATYNWYSDVSF